jgi:UDP-N-acetylglucosamine--N-acetylmuramyl-(pentapeptide) pyrophosphoryl-undecaprenol N-acetylglucosamine transferase
MRVMITGGGTGGHTSPAVAIIEELRLRDPQLELQWVGCARSIEERVSASMSIPFRSLPVKGWPRNGRIRQVAALITLSLGMVRACLYLRKFRPQVVVGVGGYVSVPLIFMAQKMGIPTVLHEQNKQLGMANRLLAQHARHILLSFPETKGDYPAEIAEVVGNPVRPGFAQAPSCEDACRASELDPAIPVVLVTGGSQGSETLNRMMSELVSAFGENDVQFIWMTGKSYVGKARKAAEHVDCAVSIYGFIDDMVTACAAARIIIGRAGASTTAELATMGRASVLVPYPHATDNHQEENARAFEEAGAAVVVLDGDCTAVAMEATLRDLLTHQEKLDAMEQAALGLAKPVAVERIVELLFSVAFDSAPGNEE